MIGGAMFDVDGTVVQGETAIPGAVEGVRRTMDAGIDPVFCSNNPTKHAAAYADKLDRAGIPTPDAPPATYALTAGTATAAYLTDTYPDEPVYVFGENGLREILREAGVRLTDDAHAATVVVASIDYDFDYESLQLAIRAIDEDTAFVGTDPDPVIPASEGFVPGSGAIATALAGVVGRDPEAYAGKPSPTVRRLVGDTLGVPFEQTLVVGDRLDTDIALGERAGATTVLVTTGVTDRGDIDASPHDPDYVLDSLADIDRVLADFE